MSATSAPSPRPLRRRLLQLHRWLSLGAAIFWLLQAITGVLIVFHWEITDSGIAGAQRPTDLTAIGRRIDTLAPAGQRHHGQVGMDDRERQRPLQHHDCRCRGDQPQRPRRR